jgi:hypothetical protein
LDLRTDTISTEEKLFKLKLVWKNIIRPSKSSPEQ